MSLKSKQKLLRKNLLSLYYTAKVGHIGSSLSCLDLLIALFQKKEKNENILLSKGHAAGALYIVLNDLGEISDDMLNTFCQNGTKLSAHPSSNTSENIPFASGSLGHGLPIGCGIAYANRLQKKNDYTYVLMSDGETNEGSVWEAAHFAVSKKLDHLIVIIDKNNLQAFGIPKDILGDTASFHKWKSLGFDVYELDGHNVSEICEKVDEFKLLKNGIPKLIIAHTTKGKGVSFMENKMEWHYLPMNEKQYQEALISLEKNYDA